MGLQGLQRSQELLSSSEKKAADIFTTKNRELQLTLAMRPLRIGTLSINGSGLSGLAE
jgi:hypothetical protein